MTDQRGATEAYQRFPYPTALHLQTHPDRLAVIARLAGMDAPDIRTARVLEIGAGNGMNLMAMAAACPDTTFLGIDIAADAIAQGREWAARAGLANIRLELLDLVDAADALDGQFDYIIAHGVFAWVPAAIADKLLEVIGRRLAPHGVAFVSFNALPGGYLRIALRDIMFRAGAGTGDEPERLATGRAALHALIQPRTGDGPAQHAFRHHARIAFDRTDGVLIHDELGAAFNPRFLGDAIAEAAAHGLAFLGDAGCGQMADAFLAGKADLQADHDTQIVAAACNRDVLDVQFFRQALFVQQAAYPRRTLDLDVLQSLFVTCQGYEVEPNIFAAGGERYSISDVALHAAINTIIAAVPRRIPVADLALDPAHLKAIFGLFDAGLLTLHTVPSPFGTSVDGRVVSSPLARMMLAENMPWVATLDHRAIELAPGPAAMVMALDETANAERLAVAARSAGLDTPAALDDGLRSLARLGLLVP